MYNILITGSEGSLGQSVIPYLTKHSIVGIDNLMRYGKRQERSKKHNYDFIHNDVRILPVTAETVIRHDIRLEQYDYVFHFAAQIYGVGGFNRHCADILSGDIAITDSLMRFLLLTQKKMPKVIFVSSSMVYETVSTSKEEDVNECTVMKTEYGLSKYTNERIIQAYGKQYAIPYTIFRPFNIITPYEIADSKEQQGESHVFADFINKIVVERQNPLEILGDGRQTRCFTWHEDAAQGIVNAAFKDHTNGEIYNIGSNEEVSMRELAITIREEAMKLGMLPEDYPVLQFKKLPPFPNDVRKRVPCITKAKNELGFQAKVPLNESIRRCLLHIK